MEELAQNPNALKLIFRGEEIFPTRTGTANVDGREHALFGNAPLEVKFLVSRALKLFVDDLIHFRARFDQGRGDDGQAAAFLDIPSGAKEALRALEGVGIYPPR